MNQENMLDVLSKKDQNKRRNIKYLCCFQMCIRFRIELSKMNSLFRSSKNNSDLGESDHSLPRLFKGSRGAGWKEAASKVRPQCLWVEEQKKITGVAWHKEVQEEGGGAAYSMWRKGGWCGLRSSAKLN